MYKYESNEKRPSEPTSKRGALSSSREEGGATFGSSRGRMGMQVASAPLGIQPKLAVNTPGDAYEREADRMADHVTRIPETRAQRKCDGCADEQEESGTLMRMEGSEAGAHEEAPSVVREVIGESGRPLDGDARSFMEPRFGRDFSHVRVHTDAKAAESARAINAEAYTVGRHMVFAPGRYNPSGSAGRHLLAHELTHVVQQSGSRAGTGSGVVARKGGQGGEEVKVPKEVMEHLKLREGWREDVYLDSKKIPTVGLGHKLTPSELKLYKIGDKIPVATLNAWAQADAKAAYTAAMQQAAAAGVSDQRFINALTSVNFQLGTGWYKEHKKTWGYIKARKWEEAADEAADSAWFKQTPVRVGDFQAAIRAMKGGTGMSKGAVHGAASAAASSDTYSFKIGAPTGSGTVTGTTLNVRKGPARSYPSTGASLSKGAAAAIYGEVDGWYCIGSGRWVSGEFVKVNVKGLDLKGIVRNVRAAMEGVGTDEGKVYSNLAKLKHDRTMIDEFKKLYRSTYRVDVITDIKGDFSNGFFGNELTKALGYLTPKDAPSATSTAKAAIPAPALKGPATAMKSGRAWVSYFPTSTSLATLTDPFKSNVSSFIAALKAAGASVTINATQRPPERAYLMHWSYKIVHDHYDVTKIPAKQGVNIDWDHGSQKKSIAAAREMTTGYEVNTSKDVAPALTSNHIRGTAIDMTISWSGTLSIKDPKGTVVNISSAPRDGTNRELMALGRKYGAIHYAPASDDPPHWSHNGR